MFYLQTKLRIQILLAKKKEKKKVVKKKVAKKKVEQKSKTFKISDAQGKKKSKKVKEVKKEN